MNTNNLRDHYFRVRYVKLDTPVKLSNGLRCDMKFQADENNSYVFSLYPIFEKLSETSMVGDYPEALAEGTAIITKPIYADENNYYAKIRERVKVGAIAYFVAGSVKLAELEIIDILDEI